MFKIAKVYSSIVIYSEINRKLLRKVDGSVLEVDYSGNPINFLYKIETEHGFNGWNITRDLPNSKWKLYLNHFEFPFGAELNLLIGTFFYRPRSRKGEELVESYEYILEALNYQSSKTYKLIPTDFNKLKTCS